MRVSFNEHARVSFKLGFGQPARSHPFEYELVKLTDFACGEDHLLFPGVGTSGMAENWWFYNNYPVFFKRAISTGRFLSMTLESHDGTPQIVTGV